MIPETDIEKLLELYKGTNKQMSILIALMKDYNNGNDRNMRNMDRIVRIIEVLSEEVISLKKRVLELEKELEAGKDD